MNEDQPANTELDRERYELLDRVRDWLATPMMVLGLVWLVLLIIELSRGLSPLLERFRIAIWVIFILHFLLEFTLAPQKGPNLKHNWLTALSLLLPALRVFRVFRALRILRAARAIRGVRLVRIISSVNRGMHSLGASLGRRGFSYVAALTTIVTLAGAAGMYAFENEVPDDPNGLTSIAFTMSSKGKAICDTLAPSSDVTHSGRGATLRRSIRVG